MVLTLSQQPWSDYPILGPYSIPVTGLGLASAVVLGADTARTGIIFANPGTKNKRVMPVGTALAGGAGGVLIYPQTEFAMLKGPGTQWNVNCAWQAVTDDAGDGTLTIFDFTPNNPDAGEVQLTIRTNMQNPISSPVPHQITGLGTGSIAVLPADPNRTGVIFQNPGDVAVAVCPANLSAAFGAGSLIVIPGEEKRIIGNEFVKVNCGWNAAAETGMANQLTALALYG